ncbi:RNA-directed DNA polymerase, eukaryota, reverse transcriptase zinc-binding domain protein [Tanacetum coccineum]
MRDWIMKCITTPKFTICVNGDRYGYFNGRRGLRQGDPISPYIFTLVMEMLNLILKDEIRKEKEFKYHFGCKQLKITHLCFADDLIMLCHGDITSVNTLKKALDKFSALSGLYPNLGKCIMFCGSLDNDTKDEISNIFPFKKGKLPVRYLGVPLVTKKIGIADCKQLVDKVTQKLNDWKNKSLSYAGRAQLIASVLGSMQWNDGDYLSKNISKKEIFYVGFNDQNKLADVMDSDGWKWPTDWFVKYLWISNMKTPILNNCPDKAVWVDSNGIERRFCTNTVWKDVRSTSAKEIWKKTCGKARMKFHNDSWNNTLDEMSKGVANKSVWGVIRKLCLDVVVYYIWQERNLRLFNNDQRDKEVLINIIIEEIKAKMLVTENHHDGAPGFKLCITEWKIGWFLSEGVCSLTSDA